MPKAFCQQLSDAETKAFKLANDGKLPEAAAAFEAIYKADPKNANPLYVLSQLYDKMGNPLKSYEYINKGWTLNPNDKDWNVNKAEALIKLTKTDEAIATADAFLLKNPEVAVMYFVKGEALDAQSKIQQAIGMYAKAIKINPDYANALFRRAKDFAVISRYQNAIDDFTALIKLESSIDEVFNRRGQAYYHLDKMNEAAADFSKAIALNAKNNFAFANRGWISFYAGNYPGALADFNISYSIDATYADASFGIASVYNKQKNYSSALTYAQKSIALNNQMPPYYAVYCSALLASDRSSEGLAAADKILSLDANNTDGYILKATALSNLQKYDDGVKFITGGIEKYPDNYILYSLRGFMYKQQGKTQLANADNEKARELSTKN